MMDIQKSMLLEEMKTDLVIHVKRLKKGLELENKYREEILKHMYTVSWPQQELLKMSQHQIKEFEDEIAADAVKDKDKD